jgi:hypothetical protein
MIDRFIADIEWQFDRIALFAYTATADRSFCPAWIGRRGTSSFGSHLLHLCRREPIQHQHGQHLGSEAMRQHDRLRAAVRRIGEQPKRPAQIAAHRY